MDSKLLSRLQRLCAKSEHCSADIYRKALNALSESTSDREAQAREIVASLIADGYLSDERYASAFARDKASICGWGPIKIRYALRSKDIPAETISAALADIDTTQADTRLERLLEAKRKALQGDPQARLKLIRFALSRGYDYDTISKLL